MAKRYVNTKGAGGRAAYAQVLARIEHEGVCPFCEEYFLRYHTRPILKKGRHWLVTENMSPYAGAKVHLLFVHRGHIEDPAKLKPAAASELLVLVQWAKKKYALPGAALFMRLGDSRYTGASVTHLHANLISGAPRGGGREPLAVVLGFKNKK